MSATAKKPRIRALLLCPCPFRIPHLNLRPKTTPRPIWCPPSIRTVLTLLLLVPGFGRVAAQREADKDTRAIVQASYIYNIAKLMEWKDPGMKNGPLVISVLGSSNLYQELVKKYAERSIGKQPIEVRKLPKGAEIGPCHVLFVARAELATLPAVQKSIAGRNTLLVTEYPDAMEDGSVVNFVEADNTVKYEISLPNARKHRLEVGSTLVQLAYASEQ